MGGEGERGREKGPSRIRVGTSGSPIGVSIFSGEIQGDTAAANPAGGVGVDLGWFSFFFFGGKKSGREAAAVCCGFCWVWVGFFFLGWEKGILGNMQPRN